MNSWFRFFDVTNRLIISVFEDEENITKCGENDLVCCKNNWFVLGPGGSYDREVFIQTDHPNYCGIFAEGSCKRRQSCGKIGNLSNYKSINFKTYLLAEVFYYVHLLWIVNYYVKCLSKNC